MEISESQEEGVCRVRIEGEMTVYHADPLKKKLFDIFFKNSELEVDLSSVRDMDTAGFQILMLLRREANMTGRRFRITSHSESTIQVVRLFKAENYLREYAGSRRQ